MKVSGQTTLDELVETHQRIWAKSGLLAKRRWMSIARGCLLTAIVLYLLPSNYRFLLAGLGALLTFVLSLATMKEWEGRFTRKFLREMMRGDGPFAITIDLTDAAIVVDQAGVQSSFPWSTIESIEHAAGWTEFWTNRGNLVLVREKLFASRELYEDFIRMACQLKESESS